jgi:hypothetical protein
MSLHGRSGVLPRRLLVVQSKPLERSPGSVLAGPSKGSMEEELSTMAGISFKVCTSPYELAGLPRLP